MWKNALSTRDYLRVIQIKWMNMQWLKRTFLPSSIFGIVNLHAWISNLSISCPDKYAIGINPSLLIVSWIAFPISPLFEFSCIFSIAFATASSHASISFLFLLNFLNQLRKLYPNTSRPHVHQNCFEFLRSFILIWIKPFSLKESKI